MDKLQHTQFFRSELWQGQSQNTNASKGQKRKNAANKRSATKPTQNQPNTMEVRFTQLEALVINMAAKVKSIAFGPRKVKDRGDNQSYGLDIDQGLFCGVGFSRLVAPSETMPHMSKDHESWATNDGNHVMVPNPNDMISTIALMTRASM